MSKDLPLNELSDELKRLTKIFKEILDGNNEDMHKKIDNKFDEIFKQAITKGQKPDDVPNGKHQVNKNNTDLIRCPNCGGHNIRKTQSDNIMKSSHQTHDGTWIDAGPKFTANKFIFYLCKDCNHDW